MRVRDVSGRLPASSFALVVIKSFPLDKVMKFTSHELGVEDLSDFPLIVAADDDRFWIRLSASGHVRDRGWFE